MRKTELMQRTDTAVEQTRDALQILWDNINFGQRKQLEKREEVKALLERYKVNYKT